jgi:hypothetical protein
MTRNGAQEAGWFERSLSALREAGPIGRASWEIITHKRMTLGFCGQKYSGGMWFDWRRLRFGIFVNTVYADRSPEDPHMVALLAHEAKHREQGILEALSVRGELVAWQLQYDVLQELSAEPTSKPWRELRALDPGARRNLKQARALIKRIGGPSYRIEYLPLWPLPAEAAHWLKSVVGRLDGDRDGE